MKNNDYLSSLGSVGESDMIRIWIEKNAAPVRPSTTSKFDFFSSKDEKYHLFACLVYLFDDIVRVVARLKKFTN